jgi:hypothetical protein
MLFAPAPVNRLFARRAGGLAASAALHALVIVAAAWPPEVQSGILQASGSPDAGREPQVVVVDSAPPSVAAGSLAPRPALELAGIEVDLDKIAGAPAELFPFIQLDPRVFAERSQADASDDLVNPLATGQGRARYPPLELSDAALQALVDRAWSRRERWRPFSSIADLVYSHDGDRGRAADLLRGYTDQNLLQPYYDGDTLDARYWTMLGLAADHRAFVDLVTRYLRERPGTRTATELLFLLDELVQGSRDTLLMVVTNAPASSLRRSASEQPVAYARAEALHADTRAWLHRQGLEDPDAIRRRLDVVRLAILQTILETTPSGYRSGDAHYLAGVIHFDQRDRAWAFELWRRSAPGPHDLYGTAMLDLRTALSLPPERQVAAVVAALGAEHGRWLTFSEQRLRRFGYDADRF